MLDKPKFTLRANGTLRQTEYQRGEPQFSVWKTKIVHLATMGCIGITECGTKFDRNLGWKSSIGIPEDAGDRLCLRCTYSVGGALAFKETGKWIPPWRMYGRSAHTPPIREKSGFRS